MTNTTKATKDFNCANACYLFHYYTKTRQKAKARFIYELLGLHQTLYPKSIMDTDLLLSKFYESKTIKSVLSDLNYQPTKIDIKTFRSSWGFAISTITLVTFTSAKGK